MGPNEALPLLRRMSHLSNTPWTSLAKPEIVSPMLQQMKQVIYFQKLLEKGFLLNNLDVDLLNLNGVTVSQDVFELLNSNGFNFSIQKSM